MAAQAFHILQKARASLLYNTVLSADQLITQEYRHFNVNDNKMSGWLNDL